MTTKIVAFLGALSHHVCKTIVEIDRRYEDVAWLAVTDIRSQPNVMDEPSGRVGAEYSFRRFLARPNVTQLDSATADIAAAVKRFAPDLGLALGAPMSRAELVDLPRLGTFALHNGRLPRSRGADPVFWALWNDDKEFCCTVEKASAAPGRCLVVAEAAVPRPNYATVRGMELILDERGIELLGDTVGQLLSGTAKVRELSAANANPVPSRRQRLTLERRLAATGPKADGLLRRAAKMGYLAARFGLGRVTTRSARRPLTVLTYHRVNDDLRDNVTVGIEQFDRQMALLRRDCHVVSIEDVLSGSLPANPSRPLVCVTFDDGYADNYTIALPILVRHGIPAAFFVSTGFIGTTRRFPHDLEKGLADLPNMNWDNLRAMRRQGQIVGSHTVNHVDCAKAEAESLRRELGDSLMTLKRELGLERAIFAYPFGRPANITAAAIEQVKKAGYLGCLSSYGGVNRGTIDPFDVRRSGVNWPFSAFGFLCRAWGFA